jgi:hypothetical protein
MSKRSTDEQGNVSVRGSLSRTISVPIFKSNKPDSSENEEFTDKERRRIRREAIWSRSSVDERRKETQFEIEKMRKLLTEKLDKVTFV